MTAKHFVEQLGNITLSNVFNPYKDLCNEFDHKNSFLIRRRNLETYLHALSKSGVDSVWLGRDCGYRGARRTGIALTDECNLVQFASHFSLDGVTKATKGEDVSERTATQVWKLIAQIKAPVFLWNIFPYHPHDAKNSFSNRNHTSREFNQCCGLLVSMLDWLRPKRIVAIGGDAQRAMSRLGYSALPVRHPSYGGHIEFADGIRRIYKIKQL